MNTVELSIIMTNRLQPLMVAAGLDMIELLDFGEAAAVALRDMGNTVDDPTAPTDDELDAVTAVNHFLDLAELRLMETALNRLLIKVNLSTGPRSQQYSDIAKGLEQAIARKQAMIEKKYGTGLGTLTAGVINWNFAEVNE